MSKKNFKPEYIPQEFYSTVMWYLSLVQNNYSTMSEMGRLHSGRIELDKISYLQNLVFDNNNILKVFYTENSNDNELFQSVFHVFYALPEWHHAYKTSGKKDALLATKLAKKLEECSGLLRESPDLWLNAQWFWEGYLKKMINDSCKECITENGKEVKNDIKKILFPSINSRMELAKKGIIEETDCIPHSVYIQLITLFIELSNYMTEIAPEAEKKSGLVKKINAEDAHIHYAARRLKEVFMKHQVPKHKHVRYINDLINGVMKEKCDEDRIRKLVG